MLKCLRLVVSALNNHYAQTFQTQVTLRSNVYAQMFTLNILNAQQTMRSNVMHVLQPPKKHHYR